MNINIELQQATIEDLKRRKANFRNYVRNLSPTEKIVQLEILQKRSYALMKAREANGGRKVPENWERWNDAQKTM